MYNVSYLEITDNSKYSIAAIAPATLKAIYQKCDINHTLKKLLLNNRKCYYSRLMLTLKEKIDQLVEEYGLVEVLDRLGELAHKYCKVDNANCTGCDRVTSLIEDARDAAREHIKKSNE